MLSKAISWWAPVAALALSSCASLAPDYQRPEAPIPSHWSETAPGSEDKVAVGMAWQSFFVDDELTQLIDIALTNNRALQAAALSLEKARAEYGINRAEYFPEIDASVAQSAGRNLNSDGQSTSLSREYSVGLGFAAYELDFFGRIGSLKAQALEQYLATEQASRSVYISLIAEVANAYLNWSASLERLRLAEETFVSQQASYELTKKTYAIGAASERDLRQAQIGMESARVDVPAYTAAVDQARNALTLLLGEPIPDGLKAADLAALADILPDVRPGLTSEVLLQRPDVLAAEHALRAANANIGAARAAFFPRVSLTASAGVSSNDVSELFDGQRVWRFMPSLTIPIFTAGRNRANLKIANIQRDIALVDYEEAIQVAFREVMDALALRETLGEKLDAQASLTAANKANYDLSEARFRLGADSYLGVLDAQRFYYSAQQALISVRLERARNRIVFFKVLGGEYGAGVADYSAELTSR